MSQVIEALDLFKIFLFGFFQGCIIFVKTIFDIGYPTNIIVFLLFFGTPIAAFFKLRFR